MTALSILILIGAGVLASLLIMGMIVLLTNLHNLHPQSGRTITAGKGEPCKEQVVTEHHFIFKPYKYKYIWWQNDPDDPRNGPDY